MIRKYNHLLRQVRFLNANFVGNNDAAAVRICSQKAFGFRDSCCCCSNDSLAKTSMTPQMIIFTQCRYVLVVYSL